MGVPGRSLETVAEVYRRATSNNVIPRMFYRLEESSGEGTIFLTFKISVSERITDLHSAHSFTYIAIDRL